MGRKSTVHTPAKKPRRTRKQTPQPIPASAPTAAAPPDEDEDDEDIEIDEDDLEEGEFDEDELDEDDVDELEEALGDPNAPIAPIEELELAIRRAIAGGKAAPFRICVRRLREGTDARRHLQPVAGWLTLEAYAAAGASLLEAVRRMVQGEPGSYVISLVDPLTKRRTPHTPVTVTVKAEQPPVEVAALNAEVDRVKARKRLVDAQVELEEAATAGARGALLAEIRALGERMERIEHSAPASQKPAWLESLMPVLSIALPPLLKRLFAPPPSPTEIIGQITPIMGAVMQATTSAQLERAKGEERRTDRMLEHAFELLAKQQGIKLDDDGEDDDSIAGLARTVLEMIRPKAAPERAPVPAAVAPRQIHAPQTHPEWTRFVRGALSCAQNGLSPEVAAKRLEERWETVPQETRDQFLSTVDADQMRAVGLLPPLVRAGLQQLTKKPGGTAWIQGFWVAMRRVEGLDGPLEAEAEDDASVEEPEIEAEPAPASEPEPATVSL